MIAGIVIGIIIGYVLHCVKQYVHIYFRTEDTDLVLIAPNYAYSALPKRLQALVCYLSIEMRKYVHGAPKSMGNEIKISDYEIKVMSEDDRENCMGA